MKKILSLLLFALALQSCNKFGDMNTDPTKSADMDPAIELAFVQQRFSGDMSTQEVTGLILCMPLAQHFGGGWANQYGQFYQRQQAYMANLWQGNYGADVKNITDAVYRSRTGSGQNINAMARVVRVYLFARLTDLYGDIPYSQAATAFTNGVLTPVYDTQEDIYHDFFAQLDTAMNQFATGQDRVTNDVFYKGDIAKWKKFTSSLRLRLALRVARQDPEFAKAQVMKAYNDGLMTSNADICVTRHDNNFNTYANYTGNGLSSAIRQTGSPVNNGYRLHSSLINQLKNTNDPRLDIFAKNYWDNMPGATFENRLDITEQVRAQIGSVGVGPKAFIWEDWMNTITINHPAAGMIQVGNNEQKLQLAAYMMENDAPFLHITYAETELLLADATIRLSLSLGATAEEHYVNGIRAACQQLVLYKNAPVISPAAIDQFIADNSLQPGKELQLIGTQLWINYFLNGPEAFASVRRTGFPVLPSGYRTDGYSDSPEMPRRLEYPLTEKTLNAANVEAAIGRLPGGVDDWEVRMWWDKE
ncbi:SusD/RagB family nutrient-binding outer membrane lipoprotein [Flavihumibacter petaseus]|nr:SusD/RagB family nutrient-binding outer membrane lipoprotein [Flavihumibacter petaseus]